jgi:hypothetical protein
MPRLTTPAPPLRTRWTATSARERAPSCTTACSSGERSVTFLCPECREWCCLSHSTLHAALQRRYLSRLSCLLRPRLPSSHLDSVGCSLALQGHGLVCVDTNKHTLSVYVEYENEPYNFAKFTHKVSLDALARSLLADSSWLPCLPVAWFVWPPLGSWEVVPRWLAAVFTPNLAVSAKSHWFSVSLQINHEQRSHYQRTSSGFITLGGKHTHTHPASTPARHALARYLGPQAFCCSLLRLILRSCLCLLV